MKVKLWRALTLNLALVQLCSSEAVHFRVQCIILGVFCHVKLHHVLLLGSVIAIIFSYITYAVVSFFLLIPIQ